MTRRSDLSGPRAWRALLAGAAALVLAGSAVTASSTAAAAPLAPAPTTLAYGYRATPLVSTTGQRFYPSTSGNPISSGTDWVAGEVRAPRGQTVDRYAAVFYVSNRSTRLLRVPGSLRTTAVDVNRHGQVTGTALLGDREQAYVWSPDSNTYRLLGSLGGASTRPSALNDAGVVVGQATDAAGRTRAFVSDPAVDAGRLRDLGVLAGDASSGATGINARGLVVGWSGTRPGAAGRAFEWSRAEPVLVDLGHPAGDDATWPTDINDDGFVVGGTASTVPADGTGRAAPSRAFVFNPYGRYYLVLPSRSDQAAVANAVNVWGVIVGTTTSGGQDDQAMIWNACGQPGRVLLQGGAGTGAVGINRYEHLVGTTAGEGTYWRRNEGACQIFSRPATG